MKEKDINKIYQVAFNNEKSISDDLISVHANNVVQESKRNCLKQNLKAIPLALQQI